MKLTEALESGCWFHHAQWEPDGLEPFSFRWMNGRLEKARRSHLVDSKTSERRFSPLEVMSSQWRLT